MCSCISTLSSAIYSFFELKEISSTPSLPRLSRHLWAPWSFFSSWTMRSSELSPASFYRWSNLLLNFTLFFAETKLSCESLCVCLRAGHNSIGETDLEKQFHQTLTLPNLRWAGWCFSHSGCSDCYMHCRCDLRAGLDNFIFIFYIYSSFICFLPCRIQWSTQFVRRQQKQTGMRTLDDTFILGEIQPLFKAWTVSEICVFRSGSTDFNDTLPNCTRAAELAFVALNFLGGGAIYIYFHNRLRD